MAENSNTKATTAEGKGKRNRKPSFRELCDTVNQLADVKNREDLITLLPRVFDVVEVMEKSRNLIKTGDIVVNKALEQCTKYALKHPKAFDDYGLTEKEKDVLTGTIKIDDVEYHYVHGYKGLKRDDGSTCNQEFLASLPGEWVRSKLELDLTGIDRAGTMPEELAKYGLVPKVVDKWTSKALVKSDAKFEQ